jgi:hypothetical protein
LSFLHCTVSGFYLRFARRVGSDFIVKPNVPVEGLGFFRRSCLAVGNPLGELVIGEIAKGATFGPDFNTTPLNVGIYADLKTADRDWRWQDLTAIIIAYVSDLRYLRVLTAGAPRVGLKPSPRILRVPH